MKRFTEADADMTADQQRRLPEVRHNLQPRYGGVEAIFQKASGSLRLMAHDGQMSWLLTPEGRLQAEPRSARS